MFGGGNSWVGRTSPSRRKGFCSATQATDFMDISRFRAFFFPISFVQSPRDETKATFFAAKTWAVKVVMAAVPTKAVTDGSDALSETLGTPPSVCWSCCRLLCPLHAP